MTMRICRTFDVVGGHETIIRVVWQSLRGHGLSPLEGWMLEPPSGRQYAWRRSACRRYGYVAARPNAMPEDQSPAGTAPAVRTGGSGGA